MNADVRISTVTHAHVDRDVPIAILIVPMEADRPASLCRAKHGVATGQKARRGRTAHFRNIRLLRCHAIAILAVEPVPTGLQVTVAVTRIFRIIGASVPLEDVDSNAPKCLFAVSLGSFKPFCEGLYEKFDELLA